MIQAADKAIDAQKKQIEIRDLRIQNNGTQIQALGAELQQTKDSRDAWYRSPIVWGLAGIIVGGILVRRF